MTSRRLLKAAEAVREVVSMAILTEIRDPRVQHVTVTGVEVAPDMRSAKVPGQRHGGRRQTALMSRGYRIRQAFCNRNWRSGSIRRYVPRLDFRTRLRVSRRVLEVGKILQELAKEREQRAADSPKPVTTPPDASDALLAESAAYRHFLYSSILPFLFSSRRFQT